ncbi:MAG: FkbM family methyltransferase [Acidobacteriota bacterium]
MKSFVRSIAIRCYVIIRSGLYRLRQVAGRPVAFRVASSMRIVLDPVGQIAELLYTSRFERRDLELVGRLLRPGMKVVDIGANIGLYSILAGKRVAPDGQVWAFEPSAETTQRLHRNLQLNEVTTVKTVRTALSDLSEKNGGRLELARDRGRGDGERFLLAGGARDLYNRERPAVEDVESVPVTTLDDYFFAGEIDPPRIDFLKIDIEGGEMLVFNGARRLLTANREIVIMFESTPESSRRYGYRQEDLFALLRDLGFHLFYWDREVRDWRSEPDRLLSAGNLWATRDQALLPRWPVGS